MTDVVDTGFADNDGNGDGLRGAFGKVNAAFAARDGQMAAQAQALDELGTLLEGKVGTGDLDAELAILDARIADTTQSLTADLAGKASADDVAAASAAAAQALADGLADKATVDDVAAASDAAAEALTTGLAGKFDKTGTLSDSQSFADGTLNGGYDETYTFTKVPLRSLRRDWRRPSENGADPAKADNWFNIDFANQEAIARGQKLIFDQLYPIKSQPVRVGNGTHWISEDNTKYGLKLANGANCALVRMTSFAEAPLIPAAIENMLFDVNGANQTAGFQAIQLAYINRLRFNYNRVINVPGTAFNATDLDAIAGGYAWYGPDQLLRHLPVPPDGIYECFHEPEIRFNLFQSIATASLGVPTADFFIVARAQGGTVSDNEFVGGGANQTAWQFNRGLETSRNIHRKFARAVYLETNQGLVMRTPYFKEFATTIIHPFLGTIPIVCIEIAPADESYQGSVTPSGQTPTPNPRYSAGTNILIDAPQFLNLVNTANTAGVHLIRIKGLPGYASYGVKIRDWSVRGVLGYDGSGYTAPCHALHVMGHAVGLSATGGDIDRISHGIFIGEGYTTGGVSAATCFVEEGRFGGMSVRNVTDTLVTIAGGGQHQNLALRDFQMDGVTGSPGTVANAYKVVAGSGPGVGFSSSGHQGAAQANPFPAA